MAERTLSLKRNPYWESERAPSGAFFSVETLGTTFPDDFLTMNPHNMSMTGGPVASNVVKEPCEHPFVK